MFDALPNYLTATGYPATGYRALWPAQLHVVGKDITRLHCVVWPAMLQRAELPLPESVWAHGFVLTGGERFSKSAGQAVALAPFMPTKAQELWAQLGGPGAVGDVAIRRLGEIDPSGWTVARAGPLFPKEETAKT